MNAEKRISAVWASLNWTQDGSIVICVKRDEGSLCLRFESADQVKQAIHHKNLIVKKWAISIPRELCILKTLSLPASNLDEATKMLEFELPSLVPISPEEIIYSCLPLTEEKNSLTILACIVKRIYIDQRLDLCKSMGIYPNHVLLDSLAIQQGFAVAGNVKEDKQILVLCDRSRATILVHANGFFHKANTIVNESRETYVGNIASTVLQYKQGLDDMSKAGSAFVFAGSDELFSTLKSQMSISSNKKFDCELQVPMPGVVDYNNWQNHDSTEVCCGAFVAAGLLEVADSENFAYFNLLPQEYLKRISNKVALFNSALTGGLAIILLFVFWLCLVTANWRIERACNIIKSEIAPIKGIAGRIGAKKEQVKAFEGQVSNRGFILKALQEFYKYTPNTISLSELRFSNKASGMKINISGQADILSNAFDYTEAVEQATLLNKLNIENAQQITRPGGKSVVEFKAECTIKDMHK